LNPDAIIISIKDNGIGIAESDFQKIFQPFYRVSSTQKFSGSGIGLSITERIIRLHNGKIEIASKPGEGAEFKILFPR
jgi:signal transduction histidine kinase